MYMQKESEVFVMKKYNEMYVELCKDFIKEFFVEHSVKNGGVEIGCFWNEAEKSGLWVRGTFETAMSKALEELAFVDTVNDENGEISV